MKMTTKIHTPGPWKALNLFLDLTPSVGAMGKQGSFDICPEVSSGIYGSLEQSRANAHLIAAAPELLSACKAILHSLKIQGLNDEAAEAAEAAINKAEGR